MCLLYQPVNYGGKRLKRPYKIIGCPFPAEQPLYPAAGFQSSPECIVPVVLIGKLHLIAAYLTLQKRVDLLEGYLASMHRHAHAVTAKRGDHSGCITGHEHVMLQLRFFIKAYLGNGNGRCIQKSGVTKDPIQVRIAAQYILL